MRIPILFDRAERPVQRAVGAALLLLAALAPYWSEPLAVSVLQAIARAIREADSGTLVLATFGRAGLYTLADGAVLIGAYLVVSGRRTFSSSRTQGVFAAVALAVL
ncbi:hypothetical protein, partial [Calditerricola satsumensis]